MSKSHDSSPVQNAVMKSSLAELAQAGGDVDALDREGRTALFYAARNGDSAIVLELISRGAKVDAEDKQRKTPLHFAASGYQLEVAELLLKNGALVDAMDTNGNTPLSDAVFESRGRGGMIKLLLSFKADKTLKNKYGVSPEGLAQSIANYDIGQYFR